MCDCYSVRCSHKGCKIEIPIHISDFALDREQVKAYCGEHEPIKKERVKYTCKKQYKDKYSCKKGTVFFFTYKNVEFPVKRESLLPEDLRERIKAPAYDEYDIFIAGPNDSGDWKEEVLYPKTGKGK